MEININGGLVAAFSAIGVAGAWIADRALRAKDETIKAKDERLAMKDAEIAALKEQLSTPDDLRSRVEVMRITHEEVRAHLDSQLAQTKEQAKRGEIVARLEVEKEARARLDGVSAQLERQITAAAALQRENNKLKLDLAELGRRQVLAPGLLGMVYDAQSKNAAEALLWSAKSLTGAAYHRLLNRELAPDAPERYGV